MSPPPPSEAELLYLLDANVLITAHRDYYSVNRVPEFWTWLAHHAEAGRVKIPAEILDEVKKGRRRKGMDDLFDWLREDRVKASLVLDEQVPDRVRARGSSLSTHRHDGSVAAPEETSQQEDPGCGQAVRDQVARCVPVYEAA